MTGRDIVNALTQSGFLDREILKADYTEEEDEALVFTFEESSEYIGDDEMKFNDIHLIVDPAGKWKLESVTWVG